MNSVYTIYNASAGAGKTYTLVKNFLSILLENENPEAIRSILAVTFTNKAANEMKVRILSWLKDFSEEKTYDSHPVLKQISKELGIDSKELSLRAKKSLSYILHHYSLLSISTIDKFNLQLMKSFTRELGLSYSFAVELDASDYLKQSIDELIDELGTDNPFAEVILNYIFWNFEKESSTDIRTDLLESSQNFLKEMHLEKISSITEKNFEEFKKLNQIISKRIHSYREKVKELAGKSLTLIENQGLEASDFFQGANGMGGFFYKALDEQKMMAVNFSSSYYIKFCEEERYAKANSSKEEDIRLIAPQLIQAFYQIKDWIKRIKIDESVRKNLITIELQSEISRFLIDKKTDQDIIFLSDVNPVISRHLKNEPVAFIYEKLGGRYRHYFIDEFQDTSQLQWTNFSPLLSDAKASDGTSITLVGDPKQAIYRFRSGKPEILIDLISTAENQNINLVTLLDNYRSLPNVVDFNNSFYQFLADTELENPEYRKLFGSEARQNPKLKTGGRVQVSFVTPSDEEENRIAQRTLEIVEDTINNGFSLKDIAILIRNKKHGFPIVNLLAEKGYPVLTEEALLVSSSPAIQAIIAAFRWIADTQDEEQLLFMLYQLWKLEKIQLEDFTSEMLKIKNKTLKETLDYLQEAFGINLKYQQHTHLSFFDYTEELTRSLGFGEEEKMYISALLDLILQLEKKGSISLYEFLENWELKSPKLSIRFPDNRDAIRIMTIHKSKGLEFPVVIYPMFPNRSKKEEYWFPLDKELYNGFNQYYTSSKSGLDEIDTDIKEIVAVREFENKIDELCVQYVATTRASQQLFLLEERKEQAKEQSPLEKFLHSRACNTEGIVELYPQENYRKKEDSPSSVPVQEEKIPWCSENWNQKIQVSTEARKFYSEENQNIQYGNSIHSVLEKIITGEEFPLISKKMILSGLMQSTQQEEIQEIINSIVEDSRLRKYFSKGIKVYQEQEILFEGRFYRPDRLVEINNKFTIIDFKTGEKLPKHKKQIELYSQALESFGKEIEEKLLVYIGNGKIEVEKV